MMPGYDRTGPAGQGPMTGRGMGYCNASRPAGIARLFGMGFRRGCGGGGRGFRNRFFNAPVQAGTQDDRIAELQASIEGLQQELTAIRQQNENSNNQR